MPTQRRYGADSAEWLTLDEVFARPSLADIVPVAIDAWRGRYSAT